MLVQKEKKLAGRRRAKHRKCKEVPANETVSLQVCKQLRPKSAPKSSGIMIRPSSIEPDAVRKPKLVASKSAQTEQCKTMQKKPCPAAGTRKRKKALESRQKRGTFQFIDHLGQSTSDQQIHVCLHGTASTCRLHRLYHRERLQHNKNEIKVHYMGVYVPPMMLFKRKNMNKNLMKGAPDGAEGVPSPTGWMDSTIFVKYLKHLLYMVTKLLQSIHIINN